MLEDHRPKLPGPPPSLRGIPNRACKVTTEGRLAVTETPRGRHDKTSGDKTTLTMAGEEPGAEASSGQGSQ